MFPLTRVQQHFLFSNSICGNEGRAKKDSTQAVVCLRTKQEEVFNNLIFLYDILMLYSGVCYLQINSQVSVSYYTSILQG